MQDNNEINSIWFNEINVNISYSTKQHVTNAGIIITCKIERENALESMQKKMDVTIHWTKVPCIKQF